MAGPAPRSALHEAGVRTWQQPACRPPAGRLRSARDERVDPVEILARVGGTSPERAYQVWVHKARAAGWTVVEEPGYLRQGDGTRCGEVLIEGLAYRVHYGPRTRSVLLEPVEPGDAHAVEQALSVLAGAPARQRPILVHAAWAEPIVPDE